VFKKIDWGYLFILSNYNLKYAKSFLPFIRILRVLDKEQVRFIWIYEPTLDFLYLAIEKDVAHIKDPDFLRYIDEVYKLDLFFKESAECLNAVYKLFDPLFNNLKHGQIVRWNMGQTVYRDVKNSTRIPLIDSMPFRASNERRYKSPVPYTFRDISKNSTSANHLYGYGYNDHYTYYMPYCNFFDSFRRNNFKLRK